MNTYSEVIIIPQNNTKIFRPKPKKLCISHNMLHNKNSHKKSYPLTPSINSNIKINKHNTDEFNFNKKPKLDFDKISFEEIERDFNKLKARSEIFEVENELLSLLRNSTKENSLEDENKDIIRIRRPKNPFLENM